MKRVAAMLTQRLRFPMSPSTHIGSSTGGWPNFSDREARHARVRLPDPIHGAREIVLIAANDELDDLDRFILEFLDPANRSRGAAGSETPGAA